MAKCIQLRHLKLFSFSDCDRKLFYFRMWTCTKPTVIRTKYPEKLPHSLNQCHIALNRFDAITDCFLCYPSCILVMQIKANYNLRCVKHAFGKQAASWVYLVKHAYSSDTILAKNKKYKLLRVKKSGEVYAVKVWSDKNTTLVCQTIIS